MAKGTGTYDDPIICDGIFSKTVNGVKKFFKLNGNSSADHATTSIGQIAWFAQPEVPNGYLVCNGAEISRETYANLFSVISTTFGKGDGSTTFTLPNLIDKFVQGSTTVGTVKSAGLPNIIGGVDTRITSYKVNPPLGVFSGSNIVLQDLNTFTPGISDTTTNVYGLEFEASRSNSIYGNSTTVQPPALTLLPCIKY